MRNETQLDRYKKLLAFIDENLKEDINIAKVEEVCHYSYRNINRIFEAIHQETIGKYIKRLRLEKAAQYLKYSEAGVSEIAYEVGFEDRTAFSKAFKQQYNCSPSAFRANNVALMETAQRSLLSEKEGEREALQFELTSLPDFDYLFWEYRGDHEDITAIEAAWDKLVAYAMDLELLSDASIFMTEIVDDADISDHIHSRYNFALMLEAPLPVTPKGFFRTRSHRRQKYAKFLHKGSYESSAAFYHEIYAYWMIDVALELADLPTLEFYPEYDQHPPEAETLTEIYIPIR